MSSFRTIKVSELRPGSILVSPVFDLNSTKLLNCGVRIDEHLIKQLLARGITEVQVESKAKKVIKARKKVPRCGGCKSVINFAPPSPELKATMLVCNNCGQIYFGSEEQGAELRGLSRADDKKINPFAESEEGQNVHVTPIMPPDDAKSLARLLTHEEVTWAERRRHKRYPVAAAIVALPLATDFRVTREAMPMTTLNVSLGGAALVHTRYVDAPYLAIDFHKAGLDMLQVVFKVLRCRNLGPLYEIGGQFVSRLS